MHQLNFCYAIFLELLISMITCTQIDGQFVNQNFPQIVCWEGLHIVNAILSIILNILFTLLSLVVSLVYFEIRMTTENPEAR
jgi:hypothetical protein